MNGLKCPIYNSTNACDMNSNCLFLRNGGCAIVLGATLADENKKKVNQLSDKIDTIDYNLRQLLNTLQQKS